MEEFLKQLKDKKVDISFGTSATERGDIVEVKDGVLHLHDENERVAYIAIERIAVVREVKDSQSRPGFLS